MNFTWFASAYDTDDVPYRLLPMVQMTGVVVFAAGVPAGLGELDFTVMRSAISRRVDAGMPAAERPSA